MIQIKKIDTRDKSQVNEFIDFEFKLYAHNSNWVPPLRMDMHNTLNPEKHPFYDHSEADFFIAVQDGKTVGRISALENRPYNRYQEKKYAQFFFFDSVDDPQVANALFDQLVEWADRRGLTKILGPKGFGPLDGYGLLVEGFEHRQVMNMVRHGFDYYPAFFDDNGFEKMVDFVSFYIDATQFKMPPRVYRIAERVENRGRLKVHHFEEKKSLLSWVEKIGVAYNNAFVNNWEYYPLSQSEIDYVLDTVIQVANPKLIKIITHDDDVVGFLFAFPDISNAMQRIEGKLFPFGVFRILWGLRRSRWLAVNGAGILPEFQGRGGNALLYAEMGKTLENYNFEHATLLQAADTAVQMRQDVETFGGKPYFTHRVYIRDTQPQ